MQTISVIGGSGFIGRYVVQSLTSKGFRVRVMVRDVVDAKHLLPLGDPGQIQIIPGSIINPSAVNRVIENTEGVINLVGILFERGRQTFEALHAEGTRNVAEACTAFDVKRLIQMSALGADLHSPSRYAQTKARGETEALKAFPDATIIRPSVVFGAEDNFLNMFAQMAVFSPFLPLVGGGHTQFQPVYVVDVAEFMVRCLENSITQGKIFELGGPAVLTMKDILTYVLKCTHRRRLLVPLPFWMAKMIGTIGQFLPTPPLTLDQVKLLQSNSIVTEGAKGFESLEMAPQPLEAIAPWYLARFRPQK